MAGAVVSGDNCSPVIMTPAINLSPISTTPMNSLSQTFIREYLCEFSKRFKKAPVEYSGARGTLIHEKKRKVENLVSDSL
jgi:hypothetical protein